MDPPQPVPPLAAGQLPLPAQQQQHRTMRRMDVATCLSLVVLQAVIWRRTAVAGLSMEGHIHQAAYMGLEVSSLALLGGLPYAAWLKYR